MRKLKKLLIAVMCMLLAVSPAMTVTVSAGSTTGKSSKGWVITSDGQRKYRKNSKAVKDCRYRAPNSKKLSSGQRSDLRAYQRARRIVNGITNSHMSKSEKLKVCYKWLIRSNGYGGWRRLSDGGNYWYAINANDLFEHRRGDCIS